MRLWKKSTWPALVRTLMFKVPFLSLKATKKQSKRIFSFRSPLPRILKTIIFSISFSSVLQKGAYISIIMTHKRKLIIAISGKTRHDICQKKIHRRKFWGIFLFTTSSNSYHYNGKALLFINKPLCNVQAQKWQIAEFSLI